MGLFRPILPSSDLRIGRRLGLQVFQLDVEWLRLQPKGRTYRWDPANFESYDRCVDQLLEQEFEPQICLSDGELPGSLKRDGGWASRDTAKRFVDYADGLSRRLSDRVGRWLTLRDLSGIASRAKVGWNESLQPPMYYLQSIHHLLMAHGPLMSLTIMFTVHSSKSSYAVQNLIRVRTGTKKRVTTVGFSILWRLKAIRKRGFTIDGTKAFLPA